MTRGELRSAGIFVSAAALRPPLLHMLVHVFIYPEHGIDGIIGISFSLHMLYFKGNKK
jgi:hypothetical protein